MGMSGKMDALRSRCSVLFVELFRKISDDPEWVAFAKKTGLRREFITGDELKKFAEEYEKKHIEIMKAQGWIK